MPQQERMPGNAGAKRNAWIRGRGSYSMRAELKRGIALNKKRLNRKIRHRTKTALHGAGYKKAEKTMRSVDFT